MTNKELTSLSIKVFVIYVLLHTIMMIAQASPIYMNMFNYSDQALWIVVPTLASVLLLIIC